MESNPFLISGYISPEYFCDREKETNTITEALLNRRHMTIFSPRRMGKTGLIRHVFYLGFENETLHSCLCRHNGNYITTGVC